MSNRRMVTIAPTGGMSMKSANPALPTQPQEIADVVAECAKAGASIVAVHARRPDDQATCNPDIYSDINARIRAKSDIIINNSTGGGNSGDMLVPRPDGLWESNFEERLRGCDGVGAEMCTFDGVTVVDTVGDKEVVVITSPLALRHPHQAHVRQGHQAGMGSLLARAYPPGRHPPHPGRL